jgi:alpha-tubulin suppressor-like RCC1 family protein
VPLTGVSTVSVGYSHSCATLTSGSVMCWGQNTYGQLGDNSTTQRLLPVAVLSPLGGALTNISQVSTYSYHTCAQTSLGAMHCWGRNSFGQLGDNSLTMRLLPAEVQASAGVPFTGISSISVGERHTCAVTVSANIFCWGGNSDLQIGNPNVRGPLSILDVFGLSGITFLQNFFSL